MHARRLCVGVSVLALAVACPAMANPRDPHVVAGQATFLQNGNKLDIHQSTNRAIIDWRSFDIELGEHTQFHQPSRNSFTLNRVNSNSPTRIQGMLTANGNIGIINQNGIYFTGTSRLDVGGLLASTSDIDNDRFMAGDLNFNKPGYVVGASIVNDGMITAREAGLVGLVAPQVANHGVIEARLGKVQLISGDTYTLDLAGDGLINIAVDRDQARRITNTGRISADGGTVTLSAAAARQNVDALVVNKGQIAANAVGVKNGKIVLSAAGAHKTNKTGTATVLNEGTITARGDKAGERGGSVSLLGDHVGLMDGSLVDVSGRAGGGTALIGGDYQGEGAVQTARATYVDDTAKINARADDAGNGGKVIVWADGITRYKGQIDARGGAQSGNGGLVEVSGKDHLAFAGRVDTRASNGAAGRLLLDPTDITISNAANSNVNGATPFSPNIDNGPSNLNIATLLSALALGNVTVQTRATGAQPGNITIVDALSWSSNTQLTLDAHNKIIVNAPITARNRLTFIANDVDLNANLIEQASGAELYFLPRANNITMGLAGGAGTFNLSTADLNRIQPGWNRVYFGRTTGTATMDVGARNWGNNPVTFYNQTGEIRFSGAQNFGTGATVIQTRNLAINNTLQGTGTLTIQPDSNVSVGLAGAAGTLNLTTAELNNILDGFSGLFIGLTSSTQNLIANAYAWRDNVQLRVGAANIQIDGVQSMGANTLSLTGRNIVMNADATGTGQVILNPDGNRTIGINGGTGLFQVTSALLSRLVGFAKVTIGNTGLTSAITMAAGTYDKAIELFSNTGIITITGDQNFGTRDFSLNSNVAPVINGNLTGTGTITFAPTSDTTTVGLAGGAGTFNLAIAALNRIIDGWSQIVIGKVGNDAAMQVGAYTWRDNIRLQSDNGAITIAGAQNVGANDLTIRSDGNPVINAVLSGTGRLFLETEATNTTMGLNGTGTFNLTTAEMNNIADGWSEIVVGRADGTGTLTVGAHNWNDPLHLRSLTGAVSITGAQNMGSNALTMTSNNVAIGAALNGTGTLTIQQANATSTMGLAGGAGTLNLTTGELDFISNGWSDLIFGRADATVGTNVRAYSNWRDNVTFRSGTGELRFEQAQNFGANNVHLATNSLRIDSNLTGTGNLTIAPSTLTTGIGLAGAAGALNLTAAELDFLSDGWNSITIGDAAMTGALAIGAYSNWRDPIRFAHASTIAVTGAQAAAGGSNASFLFDAATNLGGNITTSNGNVSFTGPVALLGSHAINTGSGDVTFGGTLDGAQDLTIGSTGDVRFNGAVGSGTRLGNLTISNPGSVTAASVLRVGNLSVTNGAGLVSLGAVDATNGVNVTSSSIALGGNITTNNGDVALNGATSLLGNYAVNTGSGDVTFGGTLDGAQDLTIGSTGDVRFNGAVGSGTRLGNLMINNPGSVTATSGLNVGSLGVTGGTGLVSLGAVDATNGVNVTSSSIALGGNITTNNGDVALNGATSLLGSHAINTGSGDVSFGGTLDGAQDLTIGSTGDVRFNGAVGSTNRLGNLTINNPGTVTGASILNVNNLTVTNGTGLVDMANANATNSITINAVGINGVYEGATGVLNANAGDITAQVSFGDLDISGARAILTAGYIGTPGPANQAMANRIRVNGVLMPLPNPNFTFAGFQIGYLPPTGLALPPALRGDLDGVQNDTLTRWDRFEGADDNLSGPWQSLIFIHPGLRPAPCSELQIKAGTCSWQEERV